MKKKIIAVLFVIGVLLMPIAIGSWSWPNSYLDPSGTWWDETLAYDNNTSTYAYTNVSYNLTLNLQTAGEEKAEVSAISWYASDYNGRDYSCKVYGYNALGWQMVFDGELPGSSWHNLTFGNATYTTVFKFQFDALGNNSGYLHEFMWNLQD